MQNTRSLAIRQSETTTCSDVDDSLTIDELHRFSDLIVPNSSLFSGSRNVRRPRPNLYVETYFIDEDGVEHATWEPPRKIDASVALPIAFEAGRRQETVVLPGFKERAIRAISIGYEETDELAFFSLDLDGGYPIRSVMKVVRHVFGDRTILHSGSGKAGRFRVFGKLARALPVHRIQALLKAIFTRFDLRPGDGCLEINPAYKHSRLPGGMGGCQVFDSITMDPIGEQDQTSFVRAALALDEIDLETVAKELGVDVSGIDTGTAQPRYRFDPYTRIERRRSVPRHVRCELSRSVEPGQRTKRQHALLKNYLRSGYSCRAAIEHFIARIHEGYFDNSNAVRQYGREYLVKQAPKIVERYYATARPLGLPDPIALSEREIALVKEIAKRVPKTRYMSPYRATKMLLALLPHFKSAKYAGLTKVRMHSDIWSRVGGVHYARMRAALGLFKSVGGYKSLSLVRSRYHLGAQDCEAYAYSWECSFDFDPQFESVTYEVATAALNFHFDERNEVVIPMKDPSPAPTAVSIDQVSLLPLNESTSSPTGSTQLYVHHKGISLDLKGSDPIVQETQPNPLVVTNALPRLQLTNPEPTIPQSELPPEAEAQTPLSWYEERAARCYERHLARLAKPKPNPRLKPEWKRLRDMSIPGAENMTLDEFFEADRTHKELVKEYQREKREAEKDRDFIGRKHGVRLSLGHCASKRFHELRKHFGLDPWH